MVTVSRGYIWAYASFQLAIVILFAYIFYNIVSKFLLIVFASQFHPSTSMGSDNTHSFLYMHSLM